MRNIDPFRYQQQQDKKTKESVNVSALVKVTSFNPTLMTVDVQPISKHLQDGTYQSQPPILGVPVASTKTGGFIIRPWIKEGDVGMVVYVDHDIDNIVSTGSETTPNTERNHSTSDAVFIGGIVTGNAPILGLPDNALVLAKEDGSAYIAVMKDKVKIKAHVEIEGDLEVTEDVVASGISLISHTHSGVESGGSSTGRSQ